MTKKKSRHEYTPEQSSWLKSCVIPEHKRSQSLADQFNTRFGTKLSAKAIRVKAERLQGKVKRGRVKVARKATGAKKHVYTPEQEGFLLEEYPLARDRPGKVSALRRKFNRRFASSVKIKSFSQKCSSLYKKNRLEKEIEKASSVEKKVGYTYFFDGKEVWSGDHHPVVRVREWTDKEVKL